MHCLVDGLIGLLDCFDWFDQWTDWLFRLIWLIKISGWFDWLVDWSVDCWGRLIHWWIGRLSAWLLVRFGWLAVFCLLDRMAWLIHWLIDWLMGRLYWVIACVLGLIVFVWLLEGFLRIEGLMWWLNRWFAIGRLIERLIGWLVDWLFDLLIGFFGWSLRSIWLIGWLVDWFGSLCCWACFLLDWSLLLIDSMGWLSWWI